MLSPSHVACSACVVGNKIVAFGGGVTASREVHIYDISFDLGQHLTFDSYLLSEGFLSLSKYISKEHVQNFVLFDEYLGVNHNHCVQVGSVPRPLIASSGIRFRNYFVNFGGYDMSRGVEMNDFMLLDLSYSSSEDASQHRPKTTSVGTSIFRSANAFASACRYADEEEEESQEEDSEVGISYIY